MPAIRIKQQHPDTVAALLAPLSRGIPSPQELAEAGPAGAAYAAGLASTGVGVGGGGGGEEKVKRKRQSQSCDACRARKVRCAREGESADLAPLAVPLSAQNSQGQTVALTPCKHCLTLSIPCTYDYQPKKRGPPNLYLKKLQAAAALEAAANTSERSSSILSMAPPHDRTPHPTLPLSLQTANQNTNPSQQGPPSASDMSVSVSPSLPSTSSHLRHLPPLSSFPTHPQPPHTHIPNRASLSTPWETALPLTPLSLPPSRYPIAADTAPHPFRTPSPLYRPPTPSLPLPSLDSFPHLPTYPMYNLPATFSPPSLHHSSLSLSPHPTTTSPQSYMPLYPALDFHFTRPHTLESIAPRRQIMEIISLFFEYVYPLTPCVHKPSFLADLAQKREERDSLFFALVMSTVAATLVQVPRACISMDRGSVRRLAQSCHEASRHITVAKYDPPMSIMVIIRYFDTIYHFCEGHDATSHACFGEAAHIAVTLHMHEESSYAQCDPIETEVRRRVFWLLFGADKSMSVLLGRPICLRDEDCTLRFPKEIDDEHISLSGVSPQPVGKISVISGLNYISRIFALLGEILVRIRLDKRNPPSGEAANRRLEELRQMHERCITALAHAPPPLRLKSGGIAAQPLQEPPPAPIAMPLPEEDLSRLPKEGYDGEEFRGAAYTELKEFFDDPAAARERKSDPFLVMQGNLYVTQQLVRFVIEQYRDELLMSLAAAEGSPPDEWLLQQARDQENVASDLLTVLHSIPIQAIATNGPSLVHKVRFVASTLLDTVRRASAMEPASAARAHAFLWDFLSILSEIERNYLLDDDRDSLSGTESVPLMGGS